MTCVAKEISLGLAAVLLALDVMSGESIAATTTPRLLNITGTVVHSQMIYDAAAPSMPTDAVGGVPLENVQDATSFLARPVAFGDFDGDGNKDIVLAPSYYYWQPCQPLAIWKGDGKGGFTDATAKILPDGPVLTCDANSLLVADFNGDGRDDIFIDDQGLEDRTYKTGALNQVLLSRPDGTLRNTSTTSLAGQRLNFNHPASMGSLNGNGVMDVALIRLGGPTPQTQLEGQNYLLLRNDGHGVFTEDAASLPPEIAFTKLSSVNYGKPFQGGGGVGLADLDGDGKAELITTSLYRGDWTGTGSWNLTPTIRVHKLDASTSKFVEVWRDTVAAEINRQSNVTLNSGVPGTTPLVPGAPVVRSADINGDGLLDLAVLWENENGVNWIEILQNTGGAQFKDVTLDYLGSYQISQVTSQGANIPALDFEFRDINGDGLADLIIRIKIRTPTTLTSTTQTSIYQNDGAGHLVPVVLARNGAALTSTALTQLMASCPYNDCSQVQGLAVMADVNNDGAEDVLLISTLYADISSTVKRTHALDVYTFLAQPAVKSGAVFSTAQSGTQSFLRLFNTGSSAATAVATLRDYATGQVRGSWTSPSIPAGAELQYAIGTVETGAGISTKPSYYSLSLQTGMSGYFQHVLFRPTDGTLTNASTCAAGVTADPAKLSGVHSSLLGSGFPSSIVVTNTGSTAQTVTLGIYDARDGTKLGTYTSSPIPAGGQAVTTVATIEAGAHVTPSSATYHYVVKIEGSFTGYLQHLVNNTQKGVITDMTTACSLDGSTGAAATSPLRDGAIFSTAQAASQSFLRFFNTGTSAGAVTVTLRDYSTGQTVGTWSSPSIPAGAEQQFAISSVETGANITGTKPSYYAISVLSTFNGYFQHVLFRPSDGTLTNLSTCAAGVTADSAKIAGVHTSLLDFGFPSSIAINNTGSTASAVTLGVYDARDGTKLGTYTSASIAAGAQLIPTSAEIEAGAHVTPSGSMYHYVLKVENAFTGFLQNLVNNLSVGVITDMTTACTLKAAS